MARRVGINDAEVRLVDKQTKIPSGTHSTSDNARKADGGEGRFNYLVIGPEDVS